MVAASLLLLLLLWLWLRLLWLLLLLLRSELLNLTHVGPPCRSCSLR